MLRWQQRTTPVLLITTYRLPKTTRSFSDEFNDLLSRTSLDLDFILISGDFNIHVENTWDYYSRDEKPAGGRQQVTGPTHNVGRPRLSQIITVTFFFTSISIL